MDNGYLPPGARRLLVVVTPVFGQTFARVQDPQNGETGLQIFCPNVTSKLLYPFQYLRGSLSLSTISVSSGDLVFTYPQRLEIR